MEVPEDVRMSINVLHQAQTAMLRTLMHHYPENAHVEVKLNCRQTRPTMMTVCNHSGRDGTVRVKKFNEKRQKWFARDVKPEQITEIGGVL